MDKTLRSTEIDLWGKTLELNFISGIDRPYCVRWEGDLDLNLLRYKSEKTAIRAYNLVKLALKMTKEEMKEYT